MLKIRMGGMTSLFTPQPEREAAREFCTLLNKVKLEKNGVRLAVSTIDKILTKTHNDNTKLRDALLEELQMCHPELLEQTHFSVEHEDLIKELV